MAISVRTRFEVFKRDRFTCQYCGKQSPDVVLEVDHIVPVAGGGDDDPINLRTSCWQCNSGKSDKPLSERVTGEDPHDRAIVLLERERQIREYNEVLRAVNDRVAADYDELEDFWPRDLNQSDRTNLRNLLHKYPGQIVKRAMVMAINARKTGGLAYVNACIRNWRDRGEI